MESISQNETIILGRRRVTVSLSNYLGREQAYVKHVLLESYLERLVHKIASVYEEFVYVDGFAGPWQSADERFEDTSFGIALDALHRAKASWKQRGRTVNMSAYLVEQNRAAYSKLEQIPSRYPDLMIKTHRADFLTVLPSILQDISPSAFAFFLIDPKGWRIPLQALAPVLSRQKSEVIFNFMFDFINRAASIEDPAVVSGLNELIPIGDWRSVLAAGEPLGGFSLEERKDILVDAFSANLRQLGGYDYVAETPVLRPTRDRTLYCLFYATRHKKGIEVFRACQVEALKEQSLTRATVKVKHAEATSGQGEIFQSLHEMGPDTQIVDLRCEHVAAEQSLLELTPKQPDAIVYDKLWPQVLGRNVVRKVDVNKIAAKLRTEGKLLIPDWEKGKHVPQGWYRLQRPEE
jgi:three-Cys-motif partner protein